MWWLLGIIFPLLTSRVVCFNGARQGSTTKGRQSRSKDNVQREAVYPYIHQEDPCAALPTSRPYQTCFPLVSTYFHHLHTTTYDVSIQDLLYQQCGATDSGRYINRLRTNNDVEGRCSTYFLLI